MEQLVIQYLAFAENEFRKRAMLMQSQENKLPAHAFPHKNWDNRELAIFEDCLMRKLELIVASWNTGSPKRKRDLTGALKAIYNEYLTKFIYISLNACPVAQEGFILVNRIGKQGG